MSMILVAQPLLGCQVPLIGLDELLPRLRALPLRGLHRYGLPAVLVRCALAPERGLGAGHRVEAPVHAGARRLDRARSPVGLVGECIEVIKQLRTVLHADLAQEEVLAPALHDRFLMLRCQGVRAVVSLAMAPLQEPALLADVLREFGDVEEECLPENLVSTDVHANKLSVVQQLRAQGILHKLSRDDHPLRPMGKPEATAFQGVKRKLHTFDLSHLNLGTT
mmetsp:Transcript_58520/g.161972  ORF Transcript_58520/g.161972 Transcript_58520/m.161972 type:complete len:222 (+) Transcript_58520:63-728(+)